MEDPPGTTMVRLIRRQARGCENLGCAIIQGNPDQISKRRAEIVDEYSIKKLKKRMKRSARENMIFFAQPTQKFNHHTYIPSGFTREEYKKRIDSQIRDEDFTPLWGAGDATNFSAHIVGIQKVFDNFFPTLDKFGFALNMSWVIFDYWRPWLHQRSQMIHKPMYLYAGIKFFRHVCDSHIERRKHEEALKEIIYDTESEVCDCVYRDTPNSYWEPSLPSSLE